MRHVLNYNIYLMNNKITSLKQRLSLFIIIGIIAGIVALTYQRRIVSIIATNLLIPTAGPFNLLLVSKIAVYVFFFIFVKHIFCLCKIKTTNDLLNSQCNKLISCFSIFIAVSRLPGINDPLVTAHDFRQTQTMLSAFWLLKEPFHFPAYLTPVFGDPWKVPFEFPTFQTLCAVLNVVGIPLDMAGRLTTILCFIVSYIFIVKILRLLSENNGTILPFSLLSLASPFGIIWSRTPLIDYCSVALCIMAVFYMLLAQVNNFKSTKHILLGLLLISLGAVTKITSVIVFIVPYLVLSAAYIYFDYKKQKNQNAIKHILILLLFCITPFISTLKWTYFCDNIKSQSITTIWLISKNMGGWNYGDLNQRIEIKNWIIIFQRIRDELIPNIWFLLVFPFFLSFEQKKSTILLFSTIIISVILNIFIFFNLFLVHEYYLICASFSTWLATSIGLSCLIDRFNYLQEKIIILFSLILLLSAYNFGNIDGNFTDLSAHPPVIAYRQIKEIVNKNQEVIIFGEEWSSRVPYYIERKCIMHYGIISEEYIKNYSSNHNVKYIVTTPAGNDALTRCFPAATKVFSSHGVSLFEIK